MPTYRHFSGDALHIKAKDGYDAQAKIDAYHSGDNCPCSKPQWGEQASAEGQDLCDCISEAQDVDSTLVYWEEQPRPVGVGAYDAIIAVKYRIYAESEEAARALADDDQGEYLETSVSVEYVGPHPLAEEC